MIKDNQVVFNRLLVLLDALLVAGSMALAYVIKAYLIGFDPGEYALNMSSYMTLLIFLVPIYVILYYLNNVYTPKRTTGHNSEILSIVRANLVGVASLSFVIFAVLHEINYSRSILFIFVFLNMVLTSLLRIVLRKTLRGVRKRGYNLKHILLVGYSRSAEHYMDRIRENPQWGYVVCGVLDDHVPAGTTYHGVKVLGRIDNLDIILPENKLDEISISLALKDYDRLEEIVEKCEKSGVHTKFIPDYNSLFPSKPYTEDLDGLPVINIRYVPLTNTGNIIVKRMVDIIGALVGIVLTSPIMLISAILVRFSGRGPIIFKQERVGLHNRTFRMYKFRTMRVESAAKEAKGWTTRNDPRVTPIGKFLRKTSIDELPQLFNILKGDMSLVGPRPERPQFVEKFKEEIPRYMVKHQVRPGLTGWAQVNGLRGDTSIQKRVEYDLYYIENWTLGFDIRIIFMTFFTGIVNKNAY